MQTFLPRAISLYRQEGDTAAAHLHHAGHVHNAKAQEGVTTEVLHHLPCSRVLYRRASGGTGRGRRQPKSQRQYIFLNGVMMDMLSLCKRISLHFQVGNLKLKVRQSRHIKYNTGQSLVSSSTLLCSKQASHRTRVQYSQAFLARRSSLRTSAASVSSHLVPHSPQALVPRGRAPTSPACAWPGP